ncbi:Zinc finger, PMZ-type [Corchorus capsularis]|uniref:Zinc finger, PMZ-type n=1 Tax=Corchorus capsularis TaxID=210143 RepID=A0A1R3GGS3_COCAP|nr:Zinc finger, PMZ-type [Corchorus capsularis]
MQSTSASIRESEVTEKEPVNDEYDYLNWFPEIVHDVVEEEPPMKLVYHHGGGFITEPTLRYVNGEVREFDWWDVDKLCSWRFFNIAMDIGYKMEKIQYCDKDDALETGLKDLESDERNSVEVDTTSIEESGDENVEEDGVDEELNSKKLIWDNDDDNGELVTSRVKLSKAIEHEEQLWNEINDVNEDAVIEDNPGLETAGPTRRAKSRANKGFSDFPKPRPRRKVEEVYFDSSDLGSFSETGSDTDSDDATRHPSSKLRFRPDAPIELYKEQNFSAQPVFGKEDLDISDCMGWTGLLNAIGDGMPFVEQRRCARHIYARWEAREKPIITMLEEIRLYVMRRIVKNRQQALDWKTDYGPSILAKLEKNWKRVDNWEVDWDGGVAFEVYHDDIELNLRERFIVSLEGRTCSCRGWDVSGVPCHYAIATILYCGKEPTDYLDDCFKRDEFLKAYQSLLHPCQGPTFWSKGNGDDILPPLVRKPKGRDKKERRREALEGQKHSAKMSRI